MASTNASPAPRRSLVESRRSTWRYAAVPLAAGATALLAQLSISIPGSPVPITGQTLAVMVAGGLLGVRRGTLAIAVYLAAGLAGLPVFAGGSGGLGHLAGPTGGFLLGLPAAAAVTGRRIETDRSRTWLTILLTMLLGHAVVFCCGLPWLAFFLEPSTALSEGLVPFLPGTAVKSALAAAIVRLRPAPAPSLPEELV